MQVGCNSILTTLFDDVDLVGGGSSLVSQTNSQLFSDFIRMLIESFPHSKQCALSTDHYERCLFHLEFRNRIANLIISHLLVRIDIALRDVAIVSIKFHGCDSANLANIL